jgi:hypothetical protein
MCRPKHVLFERSTQSKFGAPHLAFSPRSSILLGEPTIRALSESELTGRAPGCYQFLVALQGDLQAVCLFRSFRSPGRQRHAVPGSL